MVLLHKDKEQTCRGAGGASEQSGIRDAKLKESKQGRVLKWQHDTNRIEEH